MSNGWRNGGRIWKSLRHLYVSWQMTCPWSPDTVTILSRVSGARVAIAPSNLTGLLSIPLIRPRSVLSVPERTAIYLNRRIGAHGLISPLYLDHNGIPAVVGRASVPGGSHAARRGAADIAGFLKMRQSYWNNPKGRRFQVIVRMETSGGQLMRMPWRQPTPRVV